MLSSMSNTLFKRKTRPYYYARAMGKIAQVISQRTMKLKEPFAFSWHDGRRYVQTALGGGGVARNWVQKVKGHKVRGEDNPYRRPEIEKLREAYLKALPCLCFLDTEPQVAKQEMDSLKMALDEQILQERELSKCIEQLERELTLIREATELLSDPEVLAALKTLTKKKAVGN